MRELAAECALYLSSPVRMHAYLDRDPRCDLEISCGVCNPYTTGDSPDKPSSAIFASHTVQTKTTARIAPACHLAKKLQLEHAAVAIACTWRFNVSHIIQQLNST